MSYIPATTKVLNEEDLVNLIDSSLDLWLTAGRYAREFEAMLPRYMGRQIPAVFVNSGSSANLLAITALGLKYDDEVITTAAAFPTTVNPVVQNGAKPVFVDILPETLNTTLHHVVNATTNKTRAVVLAHTLGNPFEAREISNHCKQYGLQLVEDCCDALGAKLGGNPVGSFGTYATLSFYPAHQITTGEGGAVVCKDARSRRLVESLRDWGRDCWCEPGMDNTCRRRYGWKLGELPCGYDHKYTYSHLGYNLKATDMQAAIGLSQLKRLDQFVDARRTNYERLRAGVSTSPVLRDVIEPVHATPGSSPSWFGFPMICRRGVDRNQLVAFLEEHKVGTRLLFAGNLTRQPAYQSVRYRISGDLTGTEVAMHNAFWIGVHPGLDEARIAYMLEQLEAGVKKQK